MDIFQRFCIAKIEIPTATFAFLAKKRQRHFPQRNRRRPASKTSDKATPEPPLEGLANQLDQMESDNTITPDENTPTDEELSTASEDEDDDENFQDSAELFEQSTDNISPTPTPNPALSNGRKPAKHVDSSAPTRIATQPQIITGKGRELSDESDENTPLAKRNRSGNRTNKHKKHRPKKP